MRVIVACAVVLALRAAPALGQEAAPPAQPVRSLGQPPRVQPYAAVKRILQGGVHRKDAFPPALLRELHAAGKRPGHARAFTRLVRHWPSWEQARAEYGSVSLPVLLLYGDHDWSREDEREADRRAIPGARLRVVADAGHFLALDAPAVFVRAIDEFAAGLPA